MYGNLPGVAQQPRSGSLYQSMTSPQQAMYTFGPARNIQRAPGPGAGSQDLMNAYMNHPYAGASNPYERPSGLESSNPNSAYNQWIATQTALYGNGSGMPSVTTGSGNGSGGNGGNAGNNGSSNSGGYGDTVTSTIQPRPIYSPTDIQRNANQNVAQAFEAADFRGQQERFMGRGRSFDAGTASAAMPGVAQAENAAAQAQIGSPIQDWYANQANILQGQQGRANESLNMASILDQIRGSQQSAQQAMLWPMLNMMGGF